MQSVWLLALSLVQAAAQSSSSPRNAYSVQPPPPQWTSGQPYTTLGLSGPTATLVTITTPVQMFPTGSAYVVTGRTTAAPTVNSFQYAGQPMTIDGIPGYVYFPLREGSVKQSTSFTINQTDLAVYPQCWYPISV
jgi:hypothetical protein